MKKLFSKDIFNESDYPISQTRTAVLSGTGADIEELKRKPLIAVANSATEMNPGHMHLSSLAVRVKEGIHAGGGIPFEFNVPAPCDAIAEGHEGMKYVLPQRELIADTVEVYTRSMRYDAIVMIASCDKIIPGMLLAAARLDLPAIFLTGGSNTMSIRRTGAYQGSINPDDYNEVEDKLSCLSSDSCGACEIMGTANTFQCLTEVMGMSLPGSAVVPGFHAERLRYARWTGLRIVQMIEEQLTTRKILTKKSLENAVVMTQIIGGSTNATLHLPALAHELGIHLPISEFNRFGKKVPTLLAIAPNGPYGMIDLYNAGGMPATMKKVAEDLHLDTLGCTGKTLGEVLKGAKVNDPVVIPDRINAHRPEGGIAILFGNLSPEGCVVKQSAVSPEMLIFSGPARIFESEQEALASLREKTIEEGEVLVIRNEGPVGGPGMPETLAVTLALSMSSYKNVAMITDGRFSGASAGPCVGHISPEASVGGPIALLQKNDRITINIPERKLTVDLSDEELLKRRSNWKPKTRKLPDGYMTRYVRLVNSAAKGAYLDSDSLPIL